MNRREVITVLGGAAAWPLTASAQQAALPVIGFLSGGTAAGFAPLVAAFHQGLNESGYSEGRNVAIEFRWADGHNNRLPALAAELVGRKVAVIAAVGAPSALAAKAATSTIPIVFEAGVDPVERRFVASLNRPGGNVTGVSNFTAALIAKQFELLHDLEPNFTVITVMVNSTSPDLAASTTEGAQAAGHTLGQQIRILNASTVTSRRVQLAMLAARHGVPAIYNAREFPSAGGLMSYGASLTDAYRQTGIYTGKILNGAKPADLPVLQPTKFELVINHPTARMLGLTVPPTLLSTANEVIE